MKGSEHGHLSRTWCLLPPNPPTICQIWTAVEIFTRICQPHRFWPKWAKIEHARARPTAMASQHIRQMQHIQHIHTAHTYHLQRHIHFSIHPSQAIRYPLTPHFLFPASIAMRQPASEPDQPPANGPASSLVFSFFLLFSALFHGFRFLHFTSATRSLSHSRSQRLPSSSCSKANPALRTVPHHYIPLLTYSHLIPYILPYSHPPSLRPLPDPFPFVKKFP